MSTTDNPIFFRIRNFSKFQHYTDRRPPWIKLYRDLWEDHRFFSLNEKDRYLLLSLFIVASQNDNHIPAHFDWLSRECLTKVTSERIDTLMNFGWIEASDAAENKVEWASRYISKEQRRRILIRDGGLCVRCNSKKSIEIDHIVPISKGGDGQDSNLQLLCRKCNRTKHNDATDARQMLDRCKTSRARGETETDIQRQNTETEPPIVPQKTAHGKFGNVMLKTIEMESLIQKFGDPSERIEALSEYIAAKGKRYANHYATILTWERKNGNGSGHGKPRETSQERIARINKEKIDAALQDLDEETRDRYRTNGF